MEPILSNEQLLLQESAATFSTRKKAANHFRNHRDSVKKIDKAVWNEIATAGWLAILVPKQNDGLGLGLIEMSLVAKEFGQGLIPEPFSAVAATAAVTDKDLAKEIISGNLLVLPALAENKKNIRNEPSKVLASNSKNEALLTGEKYNVPYADECDGFLVSALTPDGTVLVYTPKHNLQIAMSPTIDGGSVGQLIFDQAKSYVVCGPNEAPSAISRLLCHVQLSLAAELLGLMQISHEITIEYLKTRQQFERPIGSFQALQHRSVDNLASIELCKSLVFQASKAIDSSGGSPGLASATLALTLTNSLKVCKASIQMHGGIGFTDEHDIGLYLKRALTLSTRFGNAGINRNRYAEEANIASPSFA